MPSPPDSNPKKTCSQPLKDIDLYENRKQYSSKDLWDVVNYAK